MQCRQATGQEESEDTKEKLQAHWWDLCTVIGHRSSAAASTVNQGIKGIKNCLATLRVWWKVAKLVKSPAEGKMGDL